MRYLFFISLFFITCFVSAQSSNEVKNEQYDKLFDKYITQEGITAIEISALMAQELSERLAAQGDKEAAKLMRTIKVISMITDKSNNPQFWTDLNHYAEEALLEFELINVFSDDDRQSHFYFKQHEKCTPTSEFVMISKSANEQIILYVVGDFSVSEISKLSFVKEGLKEGNDN